MNVRDRLYRKLRLRGCDMATADVVARRLIIGVIIVVAAIVVAQTMIMSSRRQLGESAMIVGPNAIAQLAHPERPWWDISWLWSHERSRFKVSRVDIRTAVKG